MARRIWLSHLIACVLAILPFIFSWQGESGDLAGPLLLGLGIAAFASWALSATAMIPLRQFRREAQRRAGGEHTVRIKPTGQPEIDQLAAALNAMAEQLTQRVEMAVRQRNESDAILDSMQECVLAIDREERILMMNKAMEELLTVNASQNRGRLVQEAVRHAGIQRYIIASTANGRRPPSTEESVLIEGPENTVLRAKSAKLRDGDGQAIGWVFLLANVTRLERLERLQKEFVANVSHELRTPVSGIKGYAETLLDGAMEDQETGRKFLQIIERQADRLNTLIEDLLSLSWLENPNQIDRNDTNIAQLLRESAVICERIRKERGATITINCPEELSAAVNGRLLEQAIVNLLENAIKYGGNPPEVSIVATMQDRRLELAVQDKGPGIPWEHQDRLFERFYRVDKARSRLLGGTGLGLSIVKHIAEIHGGHARLESRVRRGAKFILSLPIE